MGKPALRLLPLLLMPVVMVTLPVPPVLPKPVSMVGPPPLLYRPVAGGEPSVPMKQRLLPDPSLLSTET